MLLVIFGAGASFDSAPSYPPIGNATVELNRPPLADHLFDDRPLFADIMLRFPACQAIVPFLRHRTAATVEKTLHDRQAEANFHPQGQRELVAIRYYLQWTLWSCAANWESVHKGVTNYKSLLYLIRQNRKDSSPVCLVTFNYDTMLEAALPTVESKIENISEYIYGGDYKVFKMHGSVNWGRRIPPLPLKELHSLSLDQISSEVIQLAPQILSQKLVTNNYVVTDNPSVTKDTNQALFPAIALPVESKLDFELPQDHIDTLKKLLPDTTKLLIIGWRATDKPFMDFLKEHLPPHIRIMAVVGNDNEALQVFERFNEAGIRRMEFLRSDCGFTNFVLRGEAKEFLTRG